jgi:hypothetical protein
MIRMQLQSTAREEEEQDPKEAVIEVLVISHLKGQNQVSKLDRTDFELSL